MQEIRKEIRQGTRRDIILVIRHQSSQGSRDEQLCPGASGPRRTVRKGQRLLWGVGGEIPPGVWFEM